ncbi:MAG: MATE family efflux transporter [Erysipelotrichia bacterium]|nr:MATE family efflux transporter [Erysipelotrichia bacterium]NCC54167.1 MATE family efflux transporter [Erysipelotrichia bacterium]
MKYFGGSYSFYKKVASIGIPGALQQLLQSACGIVDSLMVSWIGHVSSVGTAAQIDMMMSTISYGINCGTGMFASQFYGAKEYDKLKRCFGLKLILMALNALFWLVLSLCLGKVILAFYVNDPFIIQYGNEYLRIVCLSFIPASLSYSFAYMYRGIHKALIPFLMSCFTMACNLILNYLFIFGAFGFVKLGVVGAAYGTLIAQTLTMLFYLLYSYYQKEVFVGSIKEMFTLQKDFVLPILKKTYPLVFNELLFSFGNTLFVKAFGILGKDSMDAYFVGNKISEMFYFLVWGLSDATTIILGTTLGSGKKEEALKQGNYFVGIGIVLSVFLSLLIVVSANWLVGLFQLTKMNVVLSAIWIVQAFALKISLRLFNTLVFASMRAGGESKILMILDSGITWAIGIPLAFLCVSVFDVKEIAIVFLIVQIEALVRVIIGMRLFKQGKWANNLTKLVN